MLAELTRWEVEQAGRKLAQERGWPFYAPESGKRIDGTYREPVQLVSGKYVMVERSREFTLVPWRLVIERELGRQRGLGIGM